jgi:hypothetical protein
LVSDRIYGLIGSVIWGIFKDGKLISKKEKVKRREVKPFYYLLHYLYTPGYQVYPLNN